MARSYNFVLMAALMALSFAERGFANDNAVAARTPTAERLTPAAFTPPIQLSAKDTHSGYKLPRWVSLKYDTVNGRKGPGQHFTHLWTFKRQGMPVIVINEMDNWRKIRDIEGGESWVRSVALSGEDRGLVTTHTPLMKTNKPAARVLAQLSPNVLVKIKSCGPDYCAVEIDPEVKKGKKKGAKGYVARRDIWGVDGF